MAVGRKWGGGQKKKKMGKREERWDWGLESPNPLHLCYIAILGLNHNPMIKINGIRQPNHLQKCCFDLFTRTVLDQLDHIGMLVHPIACRLPLEVYPHRDSPRIQCSTFRGVTVTYSPPNAIGSCTIQNTSILFVPFLLYAVLIMLELSVNKNLQKQLDALTFSSKRKVARAKDSEKLSHEYVNTGTNALVVSEADKTSANIANLEKPPTRDAQSLKGNQRAVPVFRRAKGRGASLQNNEEEDDES
ncbi:hypothetical protein KSP39_PZI017402 [Platanthera zijinensis]|uniref:Uncharacterized protein n=1 Tax=Platanthera zijinensis TaxID=2320716 RepID=A0AAP0B4W9_9ASPA